MAKLGRASPVRNASPGLQPTNPLRSTGDAGFSLSLAARLCLLRRANPSRAGAARTSTNVGYVLSTGRTKPNENSSKSSLASRAFHALPRSRRWAHYVRPVPPKRHSHLARAKAGEDCDSAAAGVAPKRNHADLYLCCANEAQGRLALDPPLLFCALPFRSPSSPPRDLFVRLASYPQPTTLHEQRKSIQKLARAHLAEPTPTRPHSSQRRPPPTPPSLPL